METMLKAIEGAIAEEYQGIKNRGKTLAGIEEIYRQVRFEFPELAVHIRKRMLDIAKEKGDLP